MTTKTSEAVNALIRSKAGRSSGPPEPPAREISESDIDEVARVMGLARTEAIAWLQREPAQAPAAPPGHAGAGTGNPPPTGLTVAEAMNRAIRIVTGRLKV